MTPKQHQFAREVVLGKSQADAAVVPERSSEEITAELEEKLQQFLLPETGKTKRVGETT